MNKRFLLYGAITLIVILIIGIIIVNILDNQKITKKEVNCYDKLGNKIIGQICEEEIYSHQLILIPLCFIMSILTVALMGFLIVGFGREVEEETKK